MPHRGELWGRFGIVLNLKPSCQLGPPLYSEYRDQRVQGEAETTLASPSPCMGQPEPETFLSCKSVVTKLVLDGGVGWVDRSQV